jgi:hypothetical protein
MTAKLREGLARIALAVDSVHLLDAARVLQRRRVAADPVLSARRTAAQLASLSVSRDPDLPREDVVE